MNEDELFEQTKDMSLLEILQLCGEKSIAHARVNPCFDFPNFWKETIERLYGNIIILQRGDLTTGREWHNFAGHLAGGITYKYGITHDEANGWEHKPKPFVSVDQDGPYTWTHDFYIPAALPRAGTRGLFIRLFMDGVISIEDGSFFVHPNPVVTKQLAKRFVGKYFHAKLIGLVNNACTFSKEFAPGVKYPVLPTADFFIETARNAVSNNEFWTLDWEKEIINEEEGRVEDIVPMAVEFTWELVDITF